MTGPANLGRELARIHRQIREERRRAVEAAKAAKGRIAELENRAANLEGLIFEEEGSQLVIPDGEGGEE